MASLAVGIGMIRIVVAVMIIAWPAFAVDAAEDKKLVNRFVECLVKSAPLTGGDPAVLRINMGLVRSFIEVGKRASRPLFANLIRGGWATEIPVCVLLRCHALRDVQRRR